MLYMDFYEYNDLRYLDEKKASKRTSQFIMSDPNEALLTQFQELTNGDRDQAQFYLESAGWNLAAAVETYFENNVLGEGQPMEGPSFEATPSVSSSAAAQPGSIRTFESGSEDSDSSEEGQAFYAGGSQSSGQQILGPSKRKDGRDFVKEMFKKARDNGAEAVESSSLGPSTSRKAFVGAGFKLGSDNVPSQSIGEASAPAAKPREFVLKMWKNGFSIDDGEIRDYYDPKNRLFLMSVMSGRIPPELITDAKGGEVLVNMEDHKDEDYKKPKGLVKPFGGSGNVLGSVVPDFVTNEKPQPSSNAPIASGSSSSLEEAAMQQLGFNPNETSTVVQVRLPDGRLQVKLNISHTVGDLRRYIQVARPQYTSFSLLTTFPNKELTDDAQTLNEAGIVGAALLLRSK